MTTFSRSTLRAALTAGLFATLGLHASAQSGNLPPFDFSDSFYLQNGIDPTQILGRPNGTGPNSVIDNTPNGPDLNNVRILQQAAAFDHSGHPILFYVTGLPTLASFTPNQAGQHALAIAEQYKVYEFPRAANPQFSVFPKRQDLIADLRNGYFSNNPLGAWQINLVRFTPAAFNTSGGQDALADLAADNGVDLDGTPVIRTISEIENLVDDGYASIETPPLGGPALRWFFCPVIEDPRDGAIAPDAHLDIVENANGSPLAAELEVFDMFNCLQSTGDFCNFDGVGKPYCGVVPNSSGQTALIEGQGSASVAANAFTLRGSRMPVGVQALFIAGPDARNVPFGDGRMCVAAPIRRLGPPLSVSGSGTLTRAVDLGAPPAAGAMLPGTTWYFQTWFRDPSGGPAGVNLSHGLAVTFQ